MTTQGNRFDRRIVSYITCALIALAVASPACVAQTRQQEADSPCCSHLTSQNVACIENCPTFGTDCCWLADMSIMTRIADEDLHATGQHQIQFLIWQNRCKYKAPNCSTGTCQHPGDFLFKSCIIAEPNEDDCP